YDFTTRSEETEENEERCQGNGIDLGLILSYKTHLRCGLSSQFPGRIRIGQFENRLPFTGRVAVFYQPSFRPPSRVMGEVAGLGWHYIDSTKKNVYLFKFGVEHRIAQEYFLRYGFNLCPDYRNTNIWQTTLTFGFGFTLKPLVIDFAYGLSRRNFQARDFEQLNNLRPTNMYIEENIHNLLLTFNFYL
ncbi:MAG: hypothetical protein ABIL05_02170, partial [candidate division WOR-3 bacterium]